MTTYNDLITKTFRDDAIRSVLMIDDDFLAYDQLLDASGQLNERQKFGTKKAAEIHKFFQSKKIICDVDSGADHLNVEKIRKSDLIILDYHLEQEDPQKSISIVKALSNTDHMNLVVIYTSENLEKVWLQLACSLYGKSEGGEIISDTAARSAFESEVEEAGGLPTEWSDQVTNEDLALFITGRKCTQATTQWFGQKFFNQGKYFLQATCAAKIASLCLIQNPAQDPVIRGDSGDVKWLQVGKVFVVLNKKSDQDDDSLQLWDSISKALIAWRPTYYQLLISEIQNRFENESIAFSKDLVNDSESQAAWLNQLLADYNAPYSTSTDQLFERITEELKKSVYLNPQLRGMLKSLIGLLDQDWKTKGGESILFAAAHHDLSGDQIAIELGHAINRILCSYEFSGEYVTSGTILHDRDDPDQWYLCVAPACETIPLQCTGHLAKKLKPHRFMKVLQLQKSTINVALNRASDSNCIFIKKGNTKLALSVVQNPSNQPVIDYLILKNHDSSTSEIKNTGVNASVLHLDDNQEVNFNHRVLIPVAQLRDVYTARYQSMTSHHIGRIGVDFINFTMD